MEINERIKYLRKNLGLNQTDFAKKIGMKQTGLSAIEKGKVPVLERNIKNICFEFCINEVWLRTGEGTMLNTSDAAITCSAEELNGIKKYRALDEHGKKLVNFILTEEYLRVQKTNFEPK